MFPLPALPAGSLQGRQAGDASSAASARPGQPKLVPGDLADSLLQTVGLTARGKARLSLVRALFDLLINRRCIPAISCKCSYTSVPVSTPGKPAAPEHHPGAAGCPQRGRPFLRKVLLALCSGQLVPLMRCAVPGWVRLEQHNNRQCHFHNRESHAFLGFSICPGLFGKNIALCFFHDEG